MADDTIKKSYPLATPEVAAMLGMDASTTQSAQEPPQTVSSGDLPIANLPIVEGFDEVNKGDPEALRQNVTSTPTEPTEPNAAVAYLQTEPATGSAAHGPSSSAKSGSDESDDLIDQDIAAAQPRRIPALLKTFAPYAIVFLIGIFLYGFYFKNVDFSSWFNFQNNTAVSTPKETVLAQLESQSLTGYYAWINTYYFDVSDPSIISPDSDNSGNGLTNFEKYLLNLNPKSYDTLGLGRSDTETLSMGINPLTDGPLTDSQKAIVDKYIDLEVAMNRLTLDHLQNPNLPDANSANPVGGGFGEPGNNQGRVAGATSIRGEASGSTTQIVSPTPNQVDTQVNLGASQTSYAVQDAGTNISINTPIPGRLDVPSLKMDVPIIWTTNTADFDTDLESGVVHYPGTAMPGELGTTYIAGHSSNYVWAKGSYNHVFTHLDELAVDTSFTITVTQTNGKQAIFHYVVTSQQQFSPTDQAQFRNQAKSIVALSTCWPVNSTAKRLVVFGQLTQVDQ